MMEASNRELRDGTRVPKPQKMFRCLLTLRVVLARLEIEVALKEA